MGQHRHNLRPSHRAKVFVVASFAGLVFLIVFGAALGAKVSPLVLVSLIGVLASVTVAGGWVNGPPLANRQALADAGNRLDWPDSKVRFVYRTQTAMLVLAIAGLLVASVMTH